MACQASCGVASSAPLSQLGAGLAWATPAGELVQKSKLLCSMENREDLLLCLGQNVNQGKGEFHWRWCGESNLDQYG